VFSCLPLSISRTETAKEILDKHTSQLVFHCVAQERANVTPQKLIQAADRSDPAKRIRRHYDWPHLRALGRYTGRFLSSLQAKEDLAEACLKVWDQMGAAMEEAAPFRRMAALERKFLATWIFLGVYSKIPRFSNPALPAGSLRCANLAAAAQVRFSVRQWRPMRSQSLFTFHVT